MKLNEIDKEITQSDLEALETFADRIFGKVGIDVEFTRHFLDRVNDERNGKQITASELTRLFKQEHKKWGKPIAKMGPDAEAVMKDLSTDINMPFALVWDKENEELDLIVKTVMRKSNFKTSNREFAVENKDYNLIAQRKTMNLSDQAIIALIASLYKELDDKELNEWNWKKPLSFPRPSVVNKPMPAKDSYGRADVKTIQLPIGSFSGKLNASKKSNAVKEKQEKTEDLLKGFDPKTTRALNMLKTKFPQADNVLSALLADVENKDRESDVADLAQELKMKNLTKAVDILQKEINLLKGDKKLNAVKEETVNEFTISDLKHMGVTQITPEQKKELQKISHENGGNITRSDLKKVGLLLQTRHVRESECSACNGTGWERVSSDEDERGCDECGGTGEIEELEEELSIGQKQQRRRNRMNAHLQKTMKKYGDAEKAGIHPSRVNQRRTQMTVKKESRLSIYDALMEIEESEAEVEHFAEAGGVGKVIPGVNTSVDVGPNEIKTQAKKFGNDVDKDGVPKKTLR